MFGLFRKSAIENFCDETKRIIEDQPKPNRKFKYGDTVYWVPIHHRIFGGYHSGNVKAWKYEDGHWYYVIDGTHYGQDEIVREDDLWGEGERGQ